MKICQSLFILIRIYLICRDCSGKRLDLLLQLYPLSLYHFRCPAALSSHFGWAVVPEIHINRMPSGWRSLLFTVTITQHLHSVSID